MQTEYLIAFAIYFSTLLVIGLIAHRRHTTEADFMVGARSLNFWITALSAHASDMGSWLFMAFPMMLYLGGMPKIWIAIGLLGGMFLNWHYVAPRLRTETERYGSYTLACFFESRFKDSSGILRLLSATMMLIFVTHYLAAGLISLGYLSESLFGMDYLLGIFIATAVMLAYTSFGGFVAVAWVDFFQGIFLLIAVLLVPIMDYMHLGSIEAISRCAELNQLTLNLLPNDATAFANTIILAVAWGLGYFGMPQILTKFMGIKSASEIYKAKILGMSWQLLALGGAAATGIVGIGFFCDGLSNEELIFVEMCTTLFTPIMAGLILCGVLAATISTMDSQILVVSAIITEDFYDKLLKRPRSGKELLLVSRLSVVAISGIALFIASSRSETVYDTVFYAWSGLGCAFGPLMLTSLHAKNVNRFGAIAGILVGGLVVALYPAFGPDLAIEIPSMIPGFALSFVAIHLVSRLTRSAT